jgi:hypothetical protein
VRAPVEVARARRARGAVPAERLTVFARARDLARQGWRAFLKADPAFAEAQLVNARRSLEGVIDLDGALELVADVSLRLGAVRLNTGRGAEAEAAFVLAAALDPDRELGAAEFSPAVVAAYRQAQATRRPVASLEVRAPAGATLELDGAPAGRAGRSQDVAVGEHVLVVRAPGRLAVGQIIAVPAAGVIVDVPLEIDTAQVLLGPGHELVVGTSEDDASATVSALGVWAELDEVVLVVATWRAEQPTLLGQRCTTAPLACSPVIEVRYASAAKLAAGAADLGRRLSLPGARPLPVVVLSDARAVAPEPPGRSQPPPPRPWWRKPWVWAAIGAATAVTAGAVLLIVTDEPSSVEIIWPPLR